MSRDLLPFRPWVFGPESAFPPGASTVVLELRAVKKEFPAVIFCGCEGLLVCEEETIVGHHEHEGNHLYAVVRDFRSKKCPSCNGRWRNKYDFDCLVEAIQSLLGSIANGQDPTSVPLPRELLAWNSSQ